MKADLTRQMAKIQGMRRQCLEARGKIASAEESLHADTQDDIDDMGVKAVRGNPGAESAYLGLVKNRAMLST